MIIAYIFPTHNESRTLPRMLEDLSPFLREQDVFVVADDSNVDEKRKISEIIVRHRNVVLLSGQEKAGRGAAVRRAFEWILVNRPDVTHFIEVDCNGPHRVVDIVAISKFNHTEDFVIGSRYLLASNILRWPIYRRLMSIS